METEGPAEMAEKGGRHEGISQAAQRRTYLAGRGSGAVWRILVRHQHYGKGQRGFHRDPAAEGWICPAVVPVSLFGGRVVLCGVHTGDGRMAGGAVLPAADLERAAAPGGLWLRDGDAVPVAHSPRAVLWAGA